MVKKEFIKRLWNTKGKTYELTKNGKLPTFKDFEKLISSV
jgi:hypothetical protein